AARVRADEPDVALVGKDLMRLPLAFELVLTNTRGQIIRVGGREPDRAALAAGRGDDRWTVAAELLDVAGQEVGRLLDRTRCVGAGDDLAAHGVLVRQRNVTRVRVAVAHPRAAHGAGPLLCTGV